MNPLIIIAAGGAAVVGAVGLSTLPPEVPDSTPTIAQPAPFSDPYYDPIPVATTERPLRAPQTRQTAPEGYCPQVLETAPLIGFRDDETVLLARLAWLESRCNETILGDLDRGVSYGILQIHGPTWCEPSRYWPNGYLQTKGVLDECEDLFDPGVSVIAAKFIVNEGGYEQWSTYAAAVDE